MKICLINQPAGIGDVFFLQYVARKYLEMGYEIIWPLQERLLWIKDYITDINFCSQKDDFPGKEYYGQMGIIQSQQFVYLGMDMIHFWQNNFGISELETCMCMHAKYLQLFLDWNKWSEGFKFTRNIEKENKLYYDVLGLKDDTEYVFVNRYANTDNKRNNTLEFPEFDLPVIESEFYDGFCLFDWCKVLENAKEIHTVHTSIPYLIDVLTIKAEKYLMYQGIHNDNVKFIPFINTNPIYVPNS